MNEERDRFLTEAMGACWHDYDPDNYINTYSLEGYVCTRCKNFILGNNDFSTDEDFQKLWNWAKGQPSLKGLLASRAPDMPGHTPARNAFADALYTLLKSWPQAERARPIHPLTSS